MAQVRPAADIDYLLDYLLRHWSSIPQVEQEWPTWDPIDQEVFHLEWAVKEDRLAQLEQYLKAGALTPLQLARFEDLGHLIAQNRPILERLLNQ